MYKKIKTLLNEAVELNNKMWEEHEKGNTEEAKKIAKLIDEKVLEALRLKNDVFNNTEEAKKYLYEIQKEGLITPENRYVQMSNGKYIINTDE